MVVRRTVRLRRHPGDRQKSNDAAGQASRAIRWRHAAARHRYVGTPGRQHLVRAEWRAEPRARHRFADRCELTERRHRVSADEFAASRHDGARALRHPAGYPRRTGTLRFSRDDGRRRGSVAHPSTADRGRRLRRATHGDRRVVVLPGHAVRRNQTSAGTTRDAVDRGRDDRGAAGRGKQRDHRHRADRRRALRPRVRRDAPGRTSSSRIHGAGSMHCWSPPFSHVSSPICAAHEPPPWGLAPACRPSTISSRRAGRFRTTCD